MFLLSVAHAAGAADAAGGSGGMPQFDATHFPSQILWLAAAILVLHFLLSKIALPRVNEIITTREQAITGDTVRAEALHRTAEELQARIHERRAATQQEAQRIAAEAHAAAAQEMEGEQAVAVERIAERTREGERRVQSLQGALAGTTGDGDADPEGRAAAEVVEQVAAEVATALVARVKPGAVDPELVAAAVHRRTRADGSADGARV